ncbi:hypothetical protein DRO61_10165, partial [Candidatus Bathyarchaeota archaeon]
GGKSIAIIGRNGGGKSSLLRAIQSPINAQSIPAKPVKEGTERASVRLTLEGIRDGEPATYTYHMVFNEKAKKGKLKVTDDQGSEVGSKDIQRQLIGNISFDVDEFIRLGLTGAGKVSKPGIQEQIETMMSFLSPEERKMVLDIEDACKKVEDQRKEDKKEVKRLETLIKDNAMSEEDMNKFSLDRSQEKEEITAKMDNLSSAIQEHADKSTDIKIISGDVQSFKSKYENIESIVDINKHHSLVLLANKLEDLGYQRAVSEIQDIIDHVKRYNIDKKAIQEKIAKGKEIKAWLEANPAPDMTSLNEKMQEVRAHEDKKKIVDSIQANYKILRDLLKGVDNMTDELKKMKEAKRDVFKQSALPVKGLDFDAEQGITYKGLPFNQDHHPTSHIIALGVKIAMALNPNLKVIFIKDGSMFDQKTLKWLLKEIDDKGFQLFIEMVDWTGEKDVEVQFTEDFIA